MLDSGESDKAGDVLAEVIKRRAELANAECAGHLALRERHEDAIAYFVEALEQSKNNASILNNVGLTMAIDNRLEDAVEALKKAGRIASEDARLRKKIDLNLAMVYTIKGDLTRAKEVAGKYLWPGAQ